MTPKKILLHVCCAPCSTHAIELLMKEYEVVLFFSNSNIFPKEEYDKRLENARRIASIYGLQQIEDDYNHDAWLISVRGLEAEPEKGKRCLKCFEFNLGRASDCANRNGFELFTTTLTISPHKDSKSIFEIGRGFKGFLEIDFKKGEGFKHSVMLAEQHKLYRQNYCGCEFSRHCF